MTTTAKRILCVGRWYVGDDEPVISTVSFSAEFLAECAEDWPEVDDEWQNEPGYASEKKPQNIWRNE